MDNIQAQNLLSRNKSVFQYDEDMLQAIDMAIKALKERPQGKWIFDTMGGMVCDKCQTLFLRIANPYNFCPDCGAEMKGGAK